MVASKHAVNFGWGYEPGFGYSQAIHVGDLVVLAGQMPCDAQANVVGAGDIKAQTRQVFENMKAVLAAADLTLDDLVEIVSYHTDMADLHGMMEVKAEYLTKDFPAWTAIGVTSLALPGQLIEIKATAAAR